MKVYPVIHVESPEQSAEQAKIAFSAGSDGVFLINHGNFSGEEGLIDAYNSVRELFPHEYIGLNYLTRDAADAFKVTAQYFDEHKIEVMPDAIWSDDATDRYTNWLKIKNYVEKVDNVREADPRLKNIEYLGGIAFKYTPHYTDDPEFAFNQTTVLSKAVDVVTTSGPGTGKAPTPEKIAAMKKAAKDKELAVASGIDIDNVDKYGHDIDKVLIASGLETRPYSGRFIPEKVRQFIKKAKNL